MLLLSGNFSNKELKDSLENFLAVFVLVYIEENFSSTSVFIILLLILCFNGVVKLLGLLYKDLLLELNIEISLFKFNFASFKSLLSSSQSVNKSTCFSNSKSKVK